MSVAYFDQRLGAVQAHRWSKYAFSIIFMQKRQKRSYPWLWGYPRYHLFSLFQIIMKTIDCMVGWWR